MSETQVVSQPAMTLNQVQSYHYLITDTIDTPSIATAIANSPYQMILASYNVLDPNLASYVAQADPKHEKIILGYFDLTEASSFGNPDLFAGSALPSWLGNVNPAWSGVYSVQYWNSAWLSAIENRINLLVADGFNGIFFDVASGDAEWLPGNSFGNAANPDATKQLVSLVTEVASYVAGLKLSTPFYIIPNMPTGIAQSDPAALKMFSAIFNETAYFYTQNASSSDTSHIISLPANPAWALQNAAAYKSAGVPVFGNDYPATSNLALDFQSFAFYSALGWVPSVQDAQSSAKILENGPYMFMAVPGNTVVSGVHGFVNFISGGTVASATLNGGDSGNYIIGGPGKNVIQGGGGTDIIYAHPENSSLKDVLTLQVISGGTNNAPPPLIEIDVNGQIALAQTKITSNFSQAGYHNQIISLNLSNYGNISSIEIKGLGIYYDSASSFNNIFIEDATYQGAEISLTNASVNAGASYVNSPRDAGLSGNGFVLLNAGGVATLSGASLPATPFLADTSDTITGGTGTNTVVYRADYANYTIAPQNNGSLLVTSAATAEGPDTLTNIQHLQFTNGTLARETAAQVASELDNLQSIAASTGLIGITLTDSGTPTLSISAAQLVSDATAIAAISGSFSLSESAPAASSTIAGAANAFGNTLVFSAAASQYTISAAASGAGYTVSGNGVTDHVSNVQALQFSDVTLIVAQQPGTSTVTTGNITELYGAVFGREPDVPGLAFYQKYLAAHPDTQLTTFAHWFLSSPEYAGNPAHNYAKSSDGDVQFITDSYNNLLHRSPEAGAVPFYQNVIDRFTQGLAPGSADYAQAQFQAHALVLTYFSQSPEFLSDVQVTGQNLASAQHWLILI